MLTNPQTPKHVLLLIMTTIFVFATPAFGDSFFDITYSVTPEKEPFVQATLDTGESIPVEIVRISRCDNPKGHHLNIIFDQDLGRKKSERMIIKAVSTAAGDTEILSMDRYEFRGHVTVLK